MARCIKVAFAASIAALALAISPAVAQAAPPYSDPELIRTASFEGGLGGFELAALNVPGKTVTAYWGLTPSVFRTGASGLWCAANAVTGPPTPFGTYPADTRGTATLRLPELDDYHTSEVTFWYLMPSAAPADWFGFSVKRLDDDLFSVILDEQLPLASAWTARRYVIGSGGAEQLSRTAYKATFMFQDEVENDSGGTRGQGPTIDDVAVTGFRYGPVRQLVATQSVAPEGIQLTWSAPYRSARETITDTRPLVYRVWRSLAAYDSWTELSPAERTATTSFIDTTAEPGLIYDYVVQAWDPVPGAQHGAHTAPATVGLPGVRPQASRLDTPSVASNPLAGLPFAITGVVEPRHPAGGPVARIEISRDKVTVEQTLTATSSDVPGGSAYSATAALSPAGTWFLRAVHDDADHSYSASEWVTVTVETQRPYFSLTAKSTTLASYGSAYTFSGRLLLKGAAAPGRRVILQASTGTTTGLKDTSLVATTSATGAFSFRITPQTATYYRVRFAGETGVSTSATSAYVRVVPRAYLSTPNAPRTMYRTRTYAVTGYLRPRHTYGSVRIYLERKTSSGWRGYGYATARLSYGTSTASKYTASVRLPYRGTWRLRAYHADSGHAASRSASYDYVTVK